MPKSFDGYILSGEYPNFTLTTEKFSCSDCLNYKNVRRGMSIKCHENLSVWINANPETLKRYIPSEAVCARVRVCSSYHPRATGNPYEFIDYQWSAHV